MPRKGQTRHTWPKANPHDPYDLVMLLNEFSGWMDMMNFSHDTVAVRRNVLMPFLGWCQERGLYKAHEITKPILERYQRHLYFYRKADGQPLSVASQNDRLVIVKQFFRWLARANYILYNPASDLELPRVPKRLPRNVLNADEADQVMNLPEVDDVFGLRDRAILEVFYSTGIRRSELVHLALFDVDAKRGIVFIREGKGQKDRVVPIGVRALAWIAKYNEESRPRLVVEPDDGSLFLTNLGGPFTPVGMTELVKKYILRAGLGAIGACHIFRHTMATLMLENGADIRFVQAMLGHENLSTTEIYTHLSVEKLKEVHAATHPAKMERKTAS